MQGRRQTIALLLSALTALPGTVFAAAAGVLGRARMGEPPFDQMSDEQKRVRAKILKTMRSDRTTLPGPFAVLINAPALADGVIDLWGATRYGGRLDGRLFELTALIAARHWNAQYVWQTHSMLGLKAGLDAKVVEAIRRGARPRLARADEAVAYDLVSELYRTRDLSQASYDRGLKALGPELLVELLGDASFFCMIAMMATAFRVPGSGL